MTGKHAIGNRVPGGLSIGNLPIRFKQLKKMRVIRKFSRPKSVFKDFIEVTPAMLDAAFDIDKQLLKTPKFIKDADEL